MSVSRCKSLHMCIVYWYLVMSHSWPLLIFSLNFSNFIVASLTKILCSYWSNFSHVTLDIISYFTRRGAIVGHNILNSRHVLMSNCKTDFEIVNTRAPPSCDSSTSGHRY